MQTIWSSEMKDLKEQARWRYRSPLPTKKQRVMAKPEPNSKIKVYSEEEKLLYILKHFPKNKFSSV